MGGEICVGEEEFFLVRFSHHAHKVLEGVGLVSLEDGEFGELLEGEASEISFPLAGDFFFGAEEFEEVDRFFRRFFFWGSEEDNALEGSGG